ncbi:hypothetical protein CNMCM5793_007906 [Aspergillus hiratsukae]|uniref:Uncharacterized protein n=1 Tax=Aspergillus hiratsukae TaxID=1194566 RepID=A0A8H6QIB8_9EURO|nr:hypothetical protein CNMCM5793_007906 [Aspergillus hiratsukae]KAF7173259.1 hypothetical protein CNMCM6106_007357 [Aspergillus hiratsukae]
MTPFMSEVQSKWKPLRKEDKEKTTKEAIYDIQQRVGQLNSLSIKTHPDIAYPIRRLQSEASMPDQNASNTTVSSRARILWQFVTKDELDEVIIEKFSKTVTTYVKRRFEDNDLDFNLYLNDIDFRGGIQRPSGAKRMADRLRRVIISRPRRNAYEGICLLFRRRPVTWYSKKQSTIAPSITVAEYCAYDGNQGRYLAQGVATWLMNRYLFDFKAPVQSYGNNPDVACITGAGHIRFVGELKTPWVRGHNQSSALDDDAWLRHVLGQITEYMRDVNLKYGFISTYNKTIFLRQRQDPTTGWQIVQKMRLSKASLNPD